MARTFNGTSSDHVDYTTYTSINDLTTMSVSVWYLRTGAGGGGLGRIIEKDGTNKGWLVFTESDGSGNLSFEFDRYTTPGNWNWDRHADGSWGHLLIVYDGSTAGTTPTVYRNGTSIAVSTFQASAGTLQSDAAANIVVGNRTNLARCWAGDLCEVAVWNVLLNANHALALSLGETPRRCSPDGLVFYSPTFGIGSNEANLVGLNDGAVSGTVRANHAPTTTFTMKAFSFPLNIADQYTLMPQIQM